MAGRWVGWDAGLVVARTVFVVEVEKKRFGKVFVWEIQVLQHG